jgi:type I restriction enzyme S subunit
VWLVNHKSNRRKIASTEFIPLLPRPDLAVSDFLFYLCWSRQVMPKAQELVSGSTPSRQRVDIGSFLEIRVPVPARPEQRAIAAVLRTVQQAKQATENVIAATRQLKASLMKHLFTYGPVPVQRAEVVPLKEAETGLIPTHWQVAPFGNCVEIASGQVDPRESPYREMPHVGPENIEQGTGRLLGLKKAGELGLISGKYLFDDRHVLYSKIRPYLRKAALPSFAGICSADMYPLRPRQGLEREFLFFWLLSEPFTRAIVPSQARTGIPKVNREQLNSTAIPLPPPNEQRQMAVHLMMVDSKLDAEERRRDALDALFKSLLHHLMTGKVRVCSVEN